MIGIAIKDSEKKMAIRILDSGVFQKALGRTSAADGFIEMGIPVPINGSLLISSGTGFTLSSLSKVFPGFDSTVDMALFTQREIMIEDSPKIQDEPIVETEPDIDEIKEERIDTDPGLGETIDETSDDQERPTPEQQAGLGGGSRTRKKDRIDDTGEKFGGARKDIAGRSLRVSDLQEMTDIERDELVTKNNIWPPMKYKEMQENGVEPAVAIYLKLLRDKLPTHFKKNRTAVNQHYDMSRQSLSYSNDYSAEQYIESVTAVYKAVGSVKTMDELSVALSNFRKKYWSFNDEIEKSVSEEGEFSPRWEEYCLREQLSLSIGSKARQVIISSYVIEAVNEAATKQGWVYLIKTKVTKEKDKDTNLIPQRPHLKNITRDGEDHWDGEAIGPEEFHQMFGFRGVEFGNWLPQDERQSVLNFATDALGDLSKLLKIDYKDIGLDFLGSTGMGAAFGSRGKGKAAAHYEPGRKVFNLTRMNGAGSLAHEYGHALDYFIKHAYGENSVQFKEQTEGRKDIGYKITAVNSNFRELNRVMSHTKLTALAAAENATETGLKHCAWGGNWAISAGSELFRSARGTDISLADQYRVAVDNIIQQLKDDTLPVTSREDTANITTRTDCACRFIDRAYADLARGLNKESHIPRQSRLNMDNCLRSGMRSLESAKYYAAMPPQEQVAVSTKSNFLHNAEKLDANRSKYWSEERELFARAFESWCYDKLADQNKRSDYLVHGVEENRHGDSVRFRGNPYPAGSERQNINQHIDTLVESVSVLIHALNQEQKEQLEDKTNERDRVECNAAPTP